MLTNIHCKLLSISPNPYQFTLDIPAAWYHAATLAMAISGVQLRGLHLWDVFLECIGILIRDHSFSCKVILGYLFNRKSVTLEYNCQLLLCSPCWEVSLFRVGICLTLSASLVLRTGLGHSRWVHRGVFTVDDTRHPFLISW